MRQSTRLSRIVVVVLAAAAALALGASSAPAPATNALGSATAYSAAVGQLP
jgi:hypothetical protein